MYITSYLWRSVFSPFPFYDSARFVNVSNLTIQVILSKQLFARYLT